MATKERTPAPRPLAAKEKDALLEVLQARFEANGARHKGRSWREVVSRVVASPLALRALAQMEATGGEPDVVALGPSDGIRFLDCSPESPAGRRSLCFDEAALASRKQNRPKGSAAGLADAMGVRLLTEEEYRALQRVGTFDTKTSSWIQTPPAIRRLGGALFCDRRYDHVFVYHNGAESYYAARGFRGCLEV